MLEGRTKAQMMEAIVAGIDKKELPSMEPGAICYMLSKQGYLSDGDGHWHPHLMFFVSQTDPAAWGADVPGSPVLAFNDTWEHLTIIRLLIPIVRFTNQGINNEGKVLHSLLRDFINRITDLNLGPLTYARVTRLLPECNKT